MAKREITKDDATDDVGKDPKCLACGQTYHRCNMKDDFSTICRTKHPKNKTVNNVEHSSLKTVTVQRDLPFVKEVLIENVD